MNRTSIEWTTYTWNPVSGCSRGCPYCFARRMAGRLKGRAGYPKDDPFTPTFHPEKLNEPELIKRPSLIFVCSMGELFDPKLPEIITDVILKEIARNPRHTFQILTKRPDRAEKWIFPSNVWLGCSQDCDTTDSDDIDHIRNALGPSVRFVSFEPLLGPFFGSLANIDWVVIGAQTGPNAIRPEGQWVLNLLAMCETLNIPVFLKSNLHWPEKRQEFPRSKGQ